MATSEPAWSRLLGAVTAVLIGGVGTLLVVITDQDLSELYRSRASQPAQRETLIGIDPKRQAQRTAVNGRDCDCRSRPARGPGSRPTAYATSLLTPEKTTRAERLGPRYHSSATCRPTA